MERLTGLDASFLYLENPTNHMHVAMTMVLEPHTMPGGYSFDKIKEALHDFLEAVPRAKVKLIPFGTEIDTVLFAVGYDRTAAHSQEEVFVDGLRNVLAKVRPYCRRFIYISSTSVYGQQDGSWVDETSPCEPTQPGGIYCLAAERLVRESCPQSIILRCAGIYGPGRLLSRIADLRAGSPLAGSPESWLNLIHVDDAATAVLAASEAVLPPPIVLVVDDQPLKRVDYYAQLAQLVGAPTPRFDEAQPRSRGSGGLNKRCRNRRLKDDLHVALQYPTTAVGLRAAMQDNS